MASSPSSDPGLDTCLHQQEVLADLGDRAIASGDVDALCADAVAAVVETVGADRSAVIERLPDERAGYLRGAAGWQAARTDESVALPTDSVAGRALASTDPVVVDDLSAETTTAGSELADGGDGGSAVAVAIGRPDDPWGVLVAAASERGAFSDAAGPFLANVANALATAIDRDRTRSDVEEIYGRLSDAVFALDDEWHFTYLNDRARDLIAPDDRPLVGKNVWEEFPDAVGRRFQTEYERAMHEQEAVSFEAYYPGPLDSWFEVRAYPSESGLSVYFHDVTERKEAQQRLAEERDMFAEGPTIVFRWRNEEGWPVEYVSGNVEDALGYTPEELESGEVPYTDLLLEDDVDRIDEEVAANSDDATERFSHDPYRVETKDGEVRWVKDTTKIVRDDDGEITHYLGYLVDITERKERENDLRRYEAMIEAVDDGVYVVDEGGHFLMVNEAYAEMTGYDRAELVGEHVSLVVDDEVMARAQQTEAAMREDAVEGVKLEAELKTKSGERFPAEASFAMVPTPEGETERRIGVARDVSDRKERERELARYERIVENLPVGVYRNTPGPDGDFVAANERLAAIFDADSVEEFMEYNVSDLYTDPEQRAEFSETLNEEGMVENVELEQETLDGRTIWISVTAIEVKEGGETYFDGVIQDVTERKERQRELERTERRFEAIFEDPNILVGLLEPDGTVVDINQTAMEYIDADLGDVTGEPFWETPWWGEGDDVQDDVMEWTERAANGEYVDFETDLTRPDGQRYTLNGVFRPVTNDDGDVVSVIVSDRDVTERREYERQLAESERRYRTIADYFPNGIVTLFDHDLEYTLAAGQGFANVSIGPADVEGRHFSAVWGDEATTELEPIFEAALAGEEGSVEFTYEGREWLVHAVPITDERGEVFAGMTMARDITERKEREQELAKYETIVETINDGIYVKDEEGYFTMVNEAYAEMTGYDREELVGEHASLVVDEAAMDQSRDLRTMTADGQEENPTMEAEIQQADGGTVPTEGTFAQLETDDDVESIGVVRDVTERIEQRRRIEESERRYRTLVENFPNGAVGLFDENLEYTAVGGELMDQADIPKEERIGNRVTEIYPEELVVEIKPNFEAALEGEKNSFEVEFHDRNLFAHTLPVRNGDDEVFAGMLVVQDVTERRQAERDLRESEARFRMIAENLEEVVWMGTPDAEEFIYLNPAFEDVWGIDRTTLYDDPFAFLEMVHPADRDRVETSFRALPDERFDEEFQIVRPDGETRWVHATGARIHDEDAEMVRIVGTGQDVTERVERERQIEESERRYRTLAEHFPNGAVGVYDRDLRYTLGAGDMLGENLPSADVLEGTRIPDLFPPETVTDLEPLFRAAVEEGETGSTRTTFGGRNWQVWATPLRDADGNVFAGLSLAQDVTQQVERERELERTLDLLEKTERIADVGGWEIDMATEAVFWTDHIFDLLEVEDDEEPPLDEALDMYHDEDQQFLQEKLDEAIATQEPFDVEARLRTAATREQRWLRLQGAPEVEDGEVIAVRGAAQDITERKEREQRLEELIDRLEESNERLEQFAYAASHDLQEPLRMVSSYLQLIEQRYRDELDEDGEEFLEFAVDGADRMREMINGLLKYSRVDTRGDPFGPVDLNDVLADVRDDLQVRIEESDAAVSADSLPTVEGDAGQLRQVLQNLLDNAIEYSGDEPPRIDVTTRRAGDWWEVSVSDDGIGIAPEETDTIFDVFQSLHGPEDAGTGIGLALCERIVERHGGDIWVDTEPGDGSTFTFTLPVEGEGNE